MSGVADMVSLLVSIALGMLVAAAAVGPGRTVSNGHENDLPGMVDVCG